MRDKLRLHRKYGVNPTIPTCFFCGKEKNEILLLGAAYKGEAPMHIGVVDHRPCEECERWMKQGVILVSVKDGSDPKSPYRTGGWAVVTEEAIRRMFAPDSMVQALLKGRFGFVEDVAWDRFGLPRGKGVKANETDHDTTKQNDQ